MPTPVLDSEPKEIHGAPTEGAEEPNFGNSIGEAFQRMESFAGAGDPNKPATPPKPPAAPAAGSKPSSPTPPAKTDEPKPPEPKPTDKPAPKAAEKPVEKPAEKPAETPPEKPTERLKRWEIVDAQKKTIQEREESIRTLEARVKELEEAHEAAPPEALPALTEENAALKKQVEDLRAELHFAAVERDPEFQKQFDQPLETAFQEAYDEVQQYTITQPDGSERLATTKDLDLLLNAPKGEQLRMAEAFGIAKSEVLAHVRKITDLYRNKVRTVEERRKQFPERLKAHQQQMAKQLEEIQETFEGAKKQGLTEHPEWFKPDEGDEEGSRLLEEGAAIADAAFQGKVNPKLLPKKYQQQIKAKGYLEGKDLAEVHAAVRNKAAAYDLVAHKLNLARRVIKELQKELEQYKSSTPGPGEGGGGTDNGEPQEGTMMGALHSMTKYAR